MRKLSNEEIKKIELDILLSIDAFCKKYDIKYSLAYGTLLGAIRHKGFIPWDDDIDILMVRREYDRFINLFKNQSEFENLDIIGIEVNNGDKPFIKVIDKRTIAKRGETAIWVDVFPIDYIDDSKNYAKASFYKKIIVAKTTPFLKKKNIKYVLKRLIKLILSPFKISYFSKKILKIKNEVSKDKTYKMANIVWNRNITREIIDREIYNEYTLVEFEGYQFSAIKNWDEYLKASYGEYLVLPPENQRRTHMIDAWIEE